ncbi:hypothetical protein MRB53_011440 [Persea americana]|uniref:Uncharacterized protein n=1 Tax=Persea americana TaxID=3435 RepID=A0ACC2LVF1_PERAE|nr:hypothetical protein MRB53_011440 [Persea americana]
MSPIFQLHGQGSLRIYQGQDFDFSDECILEVISKIVEQKDLYSLHLFGGVERISTALKTNLVKGISGNEEELNWRQKEYGSNAYKKPPGRSFFFALQASKDRIILVLLVHAVLSLAFGIMNHGLKKGLYDGGRIIIAISLVVVIRATTKFGRSRELIMLTNRSTNIRVVVMRDGWYQNISIFNVVVGDIVSVKAGDHIPAAGLFLSGFSLRVKESSMIEEEDDYVDVNISYPFLLSGAKVVDGFTHMLVTSVGMNSSWGKMMSSSSSCDFDEETPLQARLVKPTSPIKRFVLGIALFIVVVMLFRYWTLSREFAFGKERNKEEVMKSIASIFDAGITIAVMAVSEGRSTIIPLTFACLMRTRMGNRALFRNLSALETVGSVTIICTGKTGTLTSKEMKVTEFWVEKETMTDEISTIAPETLSLLHQAVGQNVRDINYPYSTSLPKFSGAERAILNWAMSKLDMDITKLKQIDTFLDFKTLTKRSGVLVREKYDASSLVHVHWKGDAEVILSRCSNYYTRDGITKVIDQQARRRLEKTIQSMEAHPLRCIAFAHKIPNKTHIMEEKGLTYITEENGLTLLALMGLEELCRPRVRMDLDRVAGVDVMMMTEDNVYKARAIAFEGGILKADHDYPGTIVEGQEFKNYSVKQKIEMAEKIRVMVKSFPSHKFLMVQCLKQKGHIVAVIRDDADDDAQTMKESDIRLSMNIQGNDFANEVSDIVILDDRFTSIATVLLCGRCVYKNTHNFLQFQLTSIVVTLVINCVTAVSTSKISISAIQALWENLIIDTLCVVALAAEHPTEELMVEGPVDLKKPLITNIMWRSLVSPASFQIVLLLILKFKGQLIFHADGGINDTLIFNTSILCQVFNLFNSRNLEKKNVLEGIQDNRFAGTQRLDWRQWAASMGMAALS